MSMIQIAEHEIADRLPGLLHRVQEGDEVVIQTGSSPIVVMRMQEETAWTAAEAIQRLANRTLTVVDQSFAGDLEDVRAELNASYRPAEWH